MQERFIENNLQFTNRELAQKLGVDYYSVRYYIERHKLKRAPEQREQIRLRNGALQRGENNPNWKGGISKNNYHYKLIQKERYPERIRARELVYKAKKSGKLLPQPCFVCGSEDVQAHHPDHSKPLEVIWLCPQHHREIENERSLFSGEIKDSVFHTVTR
jgi:hypothetical protein